MEKYFYLHFFHEEWLGRVGQACQQHYDTFLLNFYFLQNTIKSHQSIIFINTLIIGVLAIQGIQWLLIHLHWLKTGENTGPEMHKAHSHLLPHIVFVHFGVDLQKLVSAGGELGPGCWHFQSFIGVSVREHHQKSRFH